MDRLFEGCLLILLLQFSMAIILFITLFIAHKLFTKQEKDDE